MRNSWEGPATVAADVGALLQGRRVELAAAARAARAQLEDARAAATAAAEAAAQQQVCGCCGPRTGSLAVWTPLPWSAAPSLIQLRASSRCAVLRPAVYESQNLHGSVFCHGNALQAEQRRHGVLMGRLEVARAAAAAARAAAEAAVADVASARRVLVGAAVRASAVGTPGGKEGEEDLRAGRAAAAAVLATARAAAEAHAEIAREALSRARAAAEVAAEEADAAEAAAAEAEAAVEGAGRPQELAARLAALRKEAEVGPVRGWHLPVFPSCSHVLTPP
jgi:hypothetical protein